MTTPLSAVRSKTPFLPDGAESLAKLKCRMGFIMDKTLSPGCFRSSCPTLCHANGLQ